MPSTASKGTKSMWYSFEYGPIHVTSISSETDYTDAPSNAYTGLQHGNFGNQLTWVEADLAKAAANRANVPWLIVTMHRAIYSRQDKDGNNQPTGNSLALQKAFEALFMKYKVDLVFAGHEHTYERHFPIANSVPVKTGVSADNKMYANPRAPVYIVTGAAGNIQPNYVSRNREVIPWNVLDTAEYGITTIRVTRNALTLKHLTAADQKVLDAFVITKN